MVTDPPAGDRAALKLERELAHVRGAIDLVAGGGASRVVLVGLSFGEPLIETARRLAEAAGVRLVPLWAADDAGADIAIERIDRV